VSHLGENVAALVDGQLSPTATERAHVHLAHCRGCRDLVEAERLMKARLTQLPAPAPGADLVGWLLALGGPSGPLPPRAGHVPGSPRPVPVVLPARTAVLSTVGDPGRPARAGRPGSGAGLRTVGAARGRVAAGRPSTYSAGSNRPAGRPGAPRRVRLAGAVLGALGVVGAGVTGLVLAGPQAQTVPVQADFRSSVVRLPSGGSSPASADVSLNLGRNGLVAVRTAQRPDPGR
jgi:hypothetical protein